MVIRADLRAYRIRRDWVFGMGDVRPRPAAAPVLVSGLAQDHWKFEGCGVAAKA